jgi:hypothetical protein
MTLGAIKVNVLIGMILSILLGRAALAETIIGAIGNASGENASYGFWNNVGRNLEMAQLTQVGAEAMVWHTLQDIKYFGPQPRFGGRRYDNLRVPDELEISWREKPQMGALAYTGELKGPYRVKVRSRIPSEVLRMAGDENYLLHLSFLAGKEPILFNWRLEKYPGTGTGNIIIVKQGGDSSK